MFLYFNKEGKLTTAIPHGEVPRQGNYLNIYVLLDLDFFDDKGEDYLDWALNVELAFPDGKLTIPFTQKEGPEQLEFRKVSDSEVTFDLVDGQEYLTYYFRFSPNQATANAGKIDALVSMQKTVNDLTNRGTGINIGLEDYVYLGKAEINIEKTFGFAKRIVNESGSHFKNLMTTIANVDARKMNREDVLKAIEDGSIDEEEALRLIEEYSVDVETLDIGTSEKYDANREDQIPTSKAVESRVLSDRLQAGQSIKIDYDKKIIDVVADAEINSNSKNPIQNKTVKKEFDNLKESYMQLNGEKPMTGDLKMEDKHIIFNKEEDNMKIGYDENDAKMSIDMQNSDYYKAQYHASGFRVGNNAIEANLDVEESKFEFSLGNNISKITPDGFSASKEGTSTSYDDGRITRYIDNYSKYVEIKLPNKSGTLVIDKDVYNKEEIQKLLSAISSLKMEIVEELPTTNISTTTIYLKLRQDGEENNIYEEYVYINNKWETIGTTAVNLSNYALKTDIPTKTSQLTNDSNFATTNQLFSKSYNDLTNKPSIPTSTSQLTNNSGFITNAVNNLTNYYLKSETYTKSEVQQLLSTISSLKLEVVTNLPTTNISSNTIYLKPLDSTKENNIYEEYIYINSKWETIGTTAVDLSNYALKADIPKKTSQLTNDSDLAYNYDITDAIDNFNADVVESRLERKFNFMTFTVESTSTISDLYQAVTNKFGDDNIPCILQLTGFTGEKIGLLNISLVASTSVYKVQFIDLETALTYYVNSIVGTTTITEFIMSSNYKVNNTNFVTNDDIGTINPITGLQFVSTGNYLQASFYDESNKAITSFKTINGQSIAGTGDITIEGGSGDSSITDLGTVNSLDDEALDVTEIGFYKFKLSKTGGAHLTACFMQVGLYYGDSTQLVLYTNENDGKIRSAFRMKNSTTSEWSSWEYNNYMSNNYLGPINYQQNGPNKEVFLILGVTKNRDSLYPNGRERGVLLYFRGNGYETTIWAVIKYYTDYSTHKFYFTAVRIDDAESLTILEAKDIPYLEELTTSSITEDMYTTYTYAKSTDIPTKTSQLENDSGFITKAVNNLTNYYLKSETYTKSEVQQLLSTISSLKLEVVTNLPTTNISSNTIYLKPLDSTKENNIYEEYIYINSKWETIGTTAVDLSNYALKEDIPTKISELEQDVELGVSEEDVMDIIENNAESTTTLDVEEATEIAIGTSETFDATSDEQIPTSKAVQTMIEEYLLTNYENGNEGSY